MDEFEQLNIQKAIAFYLLGRKRNAKTILTERFILVVHKRMFGDVWDLAGKFHRTNKNMGVDIFQIPICLRQLLNHSAFWIENKVFPEEEIALRFKHELVSIHLFPNGNGRHSRLLADIMMKHIFQRNPFHWGSQKLNKNNLRALYIAALRQADSGNFKALLDFIHYTEKQNTTGMKRAKIKKNL